MGTPKSKPNTPKPQTQTTGKPPKDKPQIGKPLEQRGFGTGVGISKSNTPKPQTQTTGNTTGPRNAPMMASGVGRAAPGGRGIGTSVTRSDVFPSAGNKPTPPSMPRSAPMMASGVGKAAPTAPKRTPMMGSGVGKAAAAMKKGGMAKMKKDEMPSKMGKVKTSPKADGVATKGKTKGKMVAMAAGGMKGYKKGGMSCK